MNEIKNIRPFTKFCMTIGMIPSSYKTSLTYEEQLLWLCNYLEETIIPAVNNNAEATTELQNLYLELKNYVDNYFSSLDVQEEINKKLDIMAKDGTLSNVIGKYVDPLIEEQNNLINALSSRMDTFTKLEEGSTTADAELEDIRIGYNGVVYQNAGTAVRTQVENLNNNINTLSDIMYFKNILGNIIENTRLSSIGAEQEHSQYNCTDFIPVKQGQTIKIVGKIDRLVYYNINKTSLASSVPIVSNVSNPTITIPENIDPVNYIRFCYSNTQTDIKCNLLNDIVFNGENFNFPLNSVNSDAINKKFNKAHYNSSGSYPGLEITLKNKNSENSTKLLLCHYISDADNGYDLYQLRGAKPIINNEEKENIIFTGGAWECAIRENNKADFVGCYPHGNQYYNNILVLLDGKIVDLTSIKSMMFNRLDFYMEATLYSYGTNKSIILGSHNIHYIFENGEITIEQMVRLTKDTILDTSFMAMLPSSKNYSDLQVIDSEIFNPSSEDTPRSIGGKYGEQISNTGIKVSMEILHDNATDGTYIYSETSSDSYNKIYKMITKNNDSFKANDILRSKTKYTFTF